MDPMTPTLVYTPAASTDGVSSNDVSQANVGFIEGDRPQFSDETAALLGSRLLAAAGILFVTLCAGFVGNLLSGVSAMWWLRLLIIAVMGGCVWLLHSRSPLTLPTLRILELAVFGSVMVQLALMFFNRISEFAAIGDATSLASVRQQTLMAWSILIFIYGTLMPNTWKRAAVIMIPAALLPYILIAVQRWWSPEVASLLDQNQATSPLPFPVVSAMIAIFASHVINSARREAFKARQLGQYRLLERLGSGGMGEVYKAEHVLLKRPCAIKLIKPSSEADAASIARFEKEVKNTAKLTHWNTIEIYDYGRGEDGTFYYVMELLPGMSLDDMVSRYGGLSPARVVYLLRQICGALQEAHDVGLIHRDIKPANIFVSKRGGVDDVAKLLDFGLVKEVSERLEGETRNAGSFSGTPLYMSPEQAFAYDEVDGRADIYSLGAVAYYMLTGQAPFRGETVVGLLAAHRSVTVIAPSQLNPAVPDELDQIVIKCMAKQPGDRYQDANALREALEQASVASGWGPDHAAAWWKSHRQSPKQPEPKKQGSPGTKAITLEATLDDVSGDGCR